MKRPFSQLLLMMALCISYPAYAELDLTGLYSGLQYSDSTDEFKPDSGSSVKENRGHVKVKVGKLMNDIVAVEGQLGLTTNSTSSQGILTYGVYLRADKDYGQYKLYGLLGASGIYAYEDNVDSVSESSGSYGVGVEIFGSKNIAVTFEYLTLLDKSIDGGDLTFDTLGVGFTYYFTEDKSYFNKNRNKIDSIRY